MGSYRRIGEYLQSDLDLVNKTCHTYDMNEDSFSPVIVSSNQLRFGYNHDAFLRYYAKSGSAWHRFPARLIRSKGALTQVQVESLRNIRDDKTSNLPINVDVSIGMPVQCTKISAPTSAWQMEQLGILFILASITTIPSK